MSAAYTLHVPRGSALGDPEALDRAALVRDGFSWGAFLVPMLWFFRHRHWFLGLGAALVVVGTAVALRYAGARSGTILVVELLLHGLIGLEGATLWRWAYAVRGRPVTDVVVASTEAEAEAKTFTRWLASAPEPVTPVTSFGPRTVPGRPAASPIIGLFPDAEGRR